MKKFLALVAVVALFVACDFASEATKLKPDVQITYVNPLAWATDFFDTLSYARIDETHFVARNSVDAHMVKLIWSYYDVNDELFYGPFELPLYMLVPGLAGDEDCAADTAVLYNVPLPLDTVRSYAFGNDIYEMKAELLYVFEDEYGWEKQDTAETWFGFMVVPLE